jgi:SAM-dependent methyltransferase
VEPRESDKKLIDLVRTSAAKRAGGNPPVLLDIGCSTGNLLFHLRSRVPGLNLVGGDISEPAIVECRNNPMLSGIRFELLDLLDLPPSAFDLIVANAATCYLQTDAYEAAIRSVARALRPGGVYISFEWLHEFDQELQIVERYRGCPEGVSLFFRPIPRVRPMFERNGFEIPAFEPFKIPIDLKQGVTYGSNEDGFEDLNSYTIPTADGRRMIFRGALYQPWCFLTARRAGAF